MACTASRSKGPRTSIGKGSAGGNSRANGLGGSGFTLNVTRSLVRGTHHFGTVVHGEVSRPLHSSSHAEITRIPTVAGRGLITMAAHRRQLSISHEPSSWEKSQAV